jgi:DNA-binding NarL/FixJ family response regulator
VRVDTGKPLSLQEFQVLGLIAEGMSDQEIAEKLGLTKHTVMTVVTRILRKTNARNRTHAAVCGVRWGLIR